MVQIVKNLPTMRETWVRALGWEEYLEEGMQATAVFLPGESPWTEEPGGLQSLRHKELDMPGSSVHGVRIHTLLCLP